MRTKHKKCLLLMISLAAAAVVQHAATMSIHVTAPHSNVALLQG